MKPGIGPRLEGRRILITGGGTGIGAATARACAAAGMKVLVSGRRVAPLEGVVDDIVRGGGVAELRVGDVADAGESEALLDAMDAAFGGTDVVFANAGYGLEKPVLAASNGTERARRLYGGVPLTMGSAASASKAPLELMPSDRVIGASAASLVVAFSRVISFPACRGTSHIRCPSKHVPVKSSSSLLNALGQSRYPSRAMK